MVLVMGIDAGFGAVGWVLVDLARDEVVHYEALKTRKQSDKRGLRVADDDARRCQKVARRILEAHREHQPMGWIVELPNAGAQSARANRAMGMATAIISTLVEIEDVPVEWVTPNMVKEVVAGKRSASKGEVRDTVHEALMWPPDMDLYKWEASHIHDAAGAVLAGRDGNMVAALQRAVQLSRS